MQHLNLWILLLLTITSYLFPSENLDLNGFYQEYVLEKKRIEIPGFPHAFNAGIVDYKAGYLMSFRVIPNASTPFLSEIGVVELDKEFNLISTPQLLDTRGANFYPSRAEDARLISVNDTLYLVYSNNIDEVISKGGFRVFIGTIKEQNGNYSLVNMQGLFDYPGASSNIREKNWSPFAYQNELYLVYSISPHIIFKPVIETSTCLQVAETDDEVSWDWGILRGGTPALEIEEGYLSIFHSVQKMKTVQSEGKDILHYFMGAYIFDKSPPFHVKAISTTPLFCEGMFEGETYQRYWGSVCCVFPCGLIVDDKYLWISYGRQDHEIWILKVDRKGLLDSLTKK